MYTKPFLHQLQNTRGYIALMATIIISAVLLILSVEGSEVGARARFDILGTEAKEQSLALGEACKDQTLATLLIDPSYLGNATTTSQVGTCYIFPILLNTPTTGVVTIKIQSRVRNSFSNLEFQIATNNIYLSNTPLPTSAITLPNPSVHLNSWKELPTLP
jgi:hypothetical protein